MTKLLSTVAAIALSLGAPSISAKAETPVNFTGVTTGDAPAVARAGCYYRYYHYYTAYGYYYQ